MASLEMARAAHKEFERYQGLLSDAFHQLSHLYGDETGVAHAAEIAPDARAGFAQFIRDGKIMLPPRPPKFPTRFFAESVPPRQTWPREAFSYYEELDERNHPAYHPVADPEPSNAPGGDPGQGSSRLKTREPSEEMDVEEEEPTER